MNEKREKLEKALREREREREKVGQFNGNYCSQQRASTLLLPSKKKKKGEKLKKRGKKSGFLFLCV